MSLEDDETALHLVSAVLAGETKLDILRCRAEYMVAIGDIVLRRGDPMQARKMWVAAYPLFFRQLKLAPGAPATTRKALLLDGPCPPYVVHRGHDDLGRWWKVLEGKGTQAKGTSCPPPRLPAKGQGGHNDSGRLLVGGIDGEGDRTKGDTVSTLTVFPLRLKGDIMPCQVGAGRYQQGGHTKQ
ncbi:hypothetical protein B0H14DRAFT_2613822 [Mycena olivaceomarginata]|nr:hypothetical protein B0H14DRAFT_2613822 [Mycena olivaceomarginata]